MVPVASVAALALLLDGTRPPAVPGPGDGVCACPCRHPTPGPGLPALVHTPSAEAFSRNRAGRELYRQRRFPQARDEYRAALAADPAFLGPRLNLACAFAQEERFAEAVKEAADLARDGYVPWGEEIRQAADLAPLTLRPERRKLDLALAAAASAWGRSLGESVFFLGRMRAPVRLPPAAVTGTLFLGLEQEIFAYLPRTGRYRQVTAEQGRVLGFLPTPDGASLVYLRAGKLVRAPGVPALLREISLRRLELATMKLGPAVPLPGDVERLELSVAVGGDAVTAPSVHVRLSGPDAPRGRVYTLTSDGHRLEPAGWAGPSPGGGPRLLLDAAGSRLTGSASRRLALLPRCGFTVRDRSERGLPPSVRVQPSAGQGAAFALAAPFGAGLGGLPFPVAQPAAAAPK